MSYGPDNQVRNGTLEPQQHLPNSGPIKGDPMKLTTSWPPVFGWFTEGFDTADLEEAKALLDELTEPAIAAAGE
jgi:hypothetical protein